MVPWLNIANLTSLPCLAHSLQLIIKDGVLLQPAVVQTLSCARLLVGHYHHLNGAFNAFRQIQSQLNLPAHVLIQYAWEAAWNKKAITAFIAECQPLTELHTHSKIVKGVWRSYKKNKWRIFQCIRNYSHYKHSQKDYFTRWWPWNHAWPKV